MAEQVQNTETVGSPEQVIEAMSTAMQVALSECTVEPVQLDEGGSQRSVETGFRRSIDPGAVRLVETTDAGGSRSYAFDTITYHDVDTAIGIRWAEGGSELERIWQPLSSKSQFLSTTVRQVDPVNFDFRSFALTLKKVPEEYSAEQEYNVFHGIAQSASKFEQQMPKRSILSRILGRLTTALTRRA